MLRPDSLAFTLLLSFLMSFGPLSIDLFLPSMPDIGRALDAPAAQLQLTISLYLVAFAIGQVIYGPFSDRVGRVPVLLAAFAIFCAASVLCRFAPNMEALVIGRVFQGLGASAAPVVVRAIVRDLHEGVHAGRQLSLMMTFTGLVPIAAPLLGGALLTFFGWRSGFVFQFAAGALAFFLVYRCVVRMPPPEASTLPVLIGQYRVIATSPIFLANLFIGCFAYAGMFAWIAGSPFVLQNLQGLSPFQFSICYAGSCAGFMVGGAIATRLVMRLGLDRTAGIGAAILTLAGVGMIACTALGLWMPLTLTVSMALYLCGLAFVHAQVTAAGLTPFPKSAGVASALIGFSQQSGGAIMGAVVGNLLGATAWPMAIGVAAAGGGSLLAWALTRGIRTGTARPANAG
jgi:DHA1 family bicyclomycin/chloramphenicol resistance-like MFS transporter